LKYGEAVFTLVWKIMKMDRTTIKWWVDRAGELEQDRNEWRDKAQSLAAQIAETKESTRLVAALTETLRLSHD
jgi:hypothetical protein